MAKFAVKEKRGPAEINEMGEKAYKLGPKENLVSSVLTTFLQSKYYESESDVTGNILAAAEQCEPEFVAKTALYARRVANMRSVSHLLAGSLAGRLSGKPFARRFYQTICQRPDDASEIFAYYLTRDHKGKMPNAMRAGFKAYLESLDAYKIDKYKMKGRSVTLKDLANLCRIKPGQETAEAWKRLFNSESLSDLHDGKILNKELTAVGGTASSEEEADELRGEVFREQLEDVKGMPIFALLRNLKNILHYAPDQIDRAVEQLTVKDKIVNSKLLPFRFASAYTEVEKYSPAAASTEVVFENEARTDLSALKAKLLSALETALGYSMENIPKLEGRTAVLVDHSGSVRGDGGGSSKVAPFSKTTTAMIGNLFGSMYGYAQDNVYIGLFGDDLVHVPIDRTKGVLEFNAYSYGQGAKCGASTEDGLYCFLRDCIQNKVAVDTLVIFSDMVIGDGGVGGWDNTSQKTFGGFQKLFKEFKAMNPNCLTVSVNINQTSGKSVFDRSLNVLQISGWSERIFEQITGQSVGYDEAIKAIEAIEL